uniref:Uncharacterized protein n=1 Tax=Bacillus subtilis subsp. natto TaxID=86029 RepID=E9RJ72_BACNA|nr:hypothetical protein [Bacillus subtilis]BAJ76987.1 hypothetical protein [Bacillus subtilis subsp. natto]
MVLEAALAASKQARCLLLIKENFSFPSIRPPKAAKKPGYLKPDFTMLF